ncbi:unnamed protein product [Prorocentrum cordatum]|uniref:Uncharacterized protein n=1 Tax=Prorocentrum cordatum TaxID=2364126 RepID=A0ABN9XJU1_9DINO|nr:unnamed protein product [Polarella glacialis]|mmetsp:Transcript_61648/g.160104  ORF Transcript_61648/g.160104 Transcript_61648/m.160104 type:complete len:143 (+) Transcript_61648:90-518(+)
MAATDAKKMTQAEVLQALSPPPFRQAKAVPSDAEVEHSRQEKWWRSDSPRDNHGDDGIGVPVAERGHDTGRFHTTSNSGSGTACHFQESSEMKAIPGYSGFIRGKASGNIIGKSFAGTVKDAEEHLATNCKAARLAAQAGQQ